MTMLLGRLLLFAGCAGWGLSMRRELYRRADCLESFRITLAELCRELTFSLYPLPELAKRAIQGSSGPVSDFFSACLRVFSEEGSESWTESWQMALQQVNLPIKPSDIRILQEAGEILGRYDGQTQQWALTEVLNRLEHAGEEAVQEARRLSRVYVTLGVAGGLFGIILLWH